MTGGQVKMARAALGLGVRELAAMAGVNPNTISRYENGGDALGSTLNAVQAALEKLGVTFIAENEASLSGGAGLRLKTSEAPSA